MAFLPLLLGLLLPSLIAAQGTIHILTPHPSIKAFTCDGGKIIAPPELCNGFSWCTDGTDESVAICSSSFDCSSTNRISCPPFLNGSSPGQCIYNNRLCDGRPDCPGGTDEEPSFCSSFNCSSINQDLGSAQDVNSVPLQKCPGGLQCITPRSICNGRNDCNDGSDEDPSLCSYSRLSLRKLLQSSPLLPPMTPSVPSTPHPPLPPLPPPLSPSLSPSPAPLPTPTLFDPLGLPPGESSSSPDISLSPPYGIPQSSMSAPGGFSIVFSVGLLAILGLVFLLPAIGAAFVWFRSIRARDARDATQNSGTDDQGEPPTSTARPQGVHRRPGGNLIGVEPGLIQALPIEVFDAEAGGLKPWKPIDLQPKGTPEETKTEGEDAVPLGRSFSENSGTSLKECPVCLSEYETGDVIKWLPDCGHAFHAPCIGAWLATKTTCPLCREQVGPAAQALAAQALAAQALDAAPHANNDESGAESSIV